MLRSDLVKKLKSLNLKFLSTLLFIPVLCVSSGLGIFLLLVLAPFLNISLSPLFTSPVVPKSLRNSTGFDDFTFDELSKSKNFSVSVKNVPATFQLSIPKLGIKNAAVETNAVTLDPVKLLGHYKGTSYPGEVGNAFIYGHSVLPMFFNPKDYRTIFSTLPKLKINDTFEINYGGTMLTYKVVSLLTKKPEEVDVFDMNPANLSLLSNSTVTLMTCVPPGSKTYRLLVVGKLVP